MAVRIAMKELLEAGAHFGHQTRRWNPKMAPYIYTKRKNIHIIDLQQTLRIFREVAQQVTELAATGATFLFVGTKKQAKTAVAKEADRCGMYHVSERWLGGMLTNFKTITNSVNKLGRLELMETDGQFDRLGNKEAKKYRKELTRLRTMLTGIRKMKKLPDMLVVIDVKRELTSVLEAKKLHIPVLGILDTNCDPDWVTHGVPGNDDAIRAIALYMRIIADAILEGASIRSKQLEQEQAALNPAPADSAVATAPVAVAIPAAAAVIPPAPANIPTERVEDVAAPAVLTRAGE